MEKGERILRNVMEDYSLSIEEMGKLFRIVKIIIESPFPAKMLRAVTSTVREINNRSDLPNILEDLK